MVCNAESPTDETVKEITLLQTELNAATETISNLENKIESLEPFTEAQLQSKSNEYIVHYTGLPSLKLSKLFLTLLLLRPLLRPPN